MPLFRKKYFYDYVKYLTNLIDKEKFFGGTENNERTKEVYSEIPARFFSPDADEIISKPADEIIERICDKYEEPETGICFIISAPGGQGKSALLRATVLQYLQKFLRMPPASYSGFFKCRGCNV
jgi:hypothetical protein